MDDKNVNKKNAEIAYPEGIAIKNKDMKYLYFN